MKKLITITIVIMLLVCFTASTLAENVVEKYEQLLVGTWIKECDFGIGINEREPSFYNVIRFDYPAGILHIESKASEKEVDSDDYTIYLSGNDSGAVYLTILNGITYDLIEACGEATFSSDGQYLNISYTDDAYFVFRKDT